MTSYELDENGKMQELEVIETGAILDMKIENDKLFVVDDQEWFWMVPNKVCLKLCTNRNRIHILVQYKTPVRQIFRRNYEN